MKRFGPLIYMGDGDPPPPRALTWRDRPGIGPYHGTRRLRVFDMSAPSSERCVADLQGTTIAALEACAAEIGYPESSRFVYLR